MSEKVFYAHSKKEKPEDEWRMMQKMERGRTEGALGFKESSQKVFDALHGFYSEAAGIFDEKEAENDSTDSYAKNFN